MRTVMLGVFTVVAAGCAAPAATVTGPVPGDPTAFLDALVGEWDATWRRDRLRISAVSEDGVVTLLRASPRDPALSRPEQAPDTLIHVWLSDNGLVAMADSNFSHPTYSELCAESRGVWAPCALAEAPWRFSFITRDSIHIGEPGEPRAVMTRSRRDRLQ